MGETALQKIIESSYNTVPYYKELLDNLNIKPADVKCKEDLVKLPILSKDQIQPKPENFVSPLYYPINDDVIVQRTSGSTGKFLKIYWAKQDFIRSLFNLWVIRSKKFRITALSKFCTFHSFINGIDRISTPKIYEANNGRSVSLSKLHLDDEHLCLYYTKMLDFRPEWLFLQPSVAYTFAEFISKNNLPIPPTLKYVELTGEFLFENYKQKIKDTFKVPVINMYGSIEVNGIAYECLNGHLHCLENNVVVEVLRDGKPVGYGEEGEIHVTSLNNTAMPFIRYALGDRVILHPPENCKCGSRNPVIEILAGRISQNIILENGKTLNSFVLHYAVENINITQGNPIIQFQIIQECLDEFTVKLVLKKSVDNTENIKNQFIDQMQTLGMHNIKWKFVFPNNVMPCTLTGKLQFFENKMVKTNKGEKL